MSGYGTAEAAKMVGVTKLTLLRWLRSGRLEEPKHVQASGQNWRLWTDADVERARKLKGAVRRGPKPKRV